MPGLSRRQGFTYRKCIYILTFVVFFLGQYTKLFQRKKRPSTILHTQLSIPIILYPTKMYGIDIVYMCQSGTKSSMTLALFIKIKGATLPLPPPPRIPNTSGAIHQLSRLGLSR
jgi:hypothetical protein